MQESSGRQSTTTTSTKEGGRQARSPRLRRKPKHFTRPSPRSSPTPTNQKAHKKNYRNETTNQQPPTTPPQQPPQNEPQNPQTPAPKHATDVLAYIAYDETGLFEQAKASFWPVKPSENRSHVRGTNDLDLELIRRQDDTVRF